jgi:hypothetical protein
VDPESASRSRADSSARSGRRTTACRRTATRARCPPTCGRSAAPTRGHRIQPRLRASGPSLSSRSSTANSWPDAPTASPCRRHNRRCRTRARERRATHSAGARNRRDDFGLAHPRPMPVLPVSTHGLICMSSFGSFARTAAAKDPRREGQTSRTSAGATGRRTQDTASIAKPCKRTTNVSFRATIRSREPGLTGRTSSLSPRPALAGERLSTATTASGSLT